jgi:hypothetical protein
VQIRSGSCSASPCGSRALHGFDAAIYTVALLDTGLATMVLIAPVTFHRIVVHRWQKAARVVVAG